jgi:hypothetical protein
MKRILLKKVKRYTKQLALIWTALFLLIILSLPDPSPNIYDIVLDQDLTIQPNFFKRDNEERIIWKEEVRRHINSEFPSISHQIELPFSPPGNDIILNKDDIVKKIDFSVIVLSPDHLNVLIRDSDNIRYEVPHKEPYPHVRK